MMPNNNYITDKKVISSCRNNNLEVQECILLSIKLGIKKKKKH